MYQKRVLRDLCSSINYGYTASASRDQVGPKFLRITDIAQSALDWDGVPYCPVEGKDLEKFRLFTGDIVIARTGATVGWAKYIADPPPAVFASYLVRIRLNEAADARFVGHLVESKEYKDFVLQHAGGAAQPNANAQVLTSFELPVPPLPIQRRIASILSAYDDLIENNRKRIAILEDMARRLYREWFVHFRYPGHESVPLVDSPLGRIPQGWEVLPLSDVVRLNPRPAVGKAPIPFIPMNCLSNDSMLIDNIESRNEPTGSRFQNGDTLLARITPCLENGKTAFVQCLDEGQTACGSTEFIVLRSLRLCPEFVYLLARSQEFRGVAIKSMTGATGRQRVQEASLAQFLVACPSVSVCAQFSNMVGPWFKLCENLHRQIQVLRRTRDLLLPRLMSGTLSVEALATAEAAVP